MNLLDVHSAKLKRVIKKYGRPVILKDPDGTVYPDLIMLWNAVEHALKINNLEAPPMGAKFSLYIDRDSLQLDTGEITPGMDWTATGSPNSFDPDETYSIEIPKQDQQLPGLLMFLSEINPDAIKLSRP